MTDLLPSPVKSKRLLRYQRASDKVIDDLDELIKLKDELIKSLKMKLEKNK